MSIQHLVWLKQKESTSIEDMSSLLEQVRRLDMLDGVVSISAGKNFTDRANGFTHGIIVTLNDQEALDNYINSEAHQILGPRLRELCDLLALDFDDSS